MHWEARIHCGPTLVYPPLNIVFVELQVENDLPEVYVNQPTQLKVSQKHQA